MLAFGQLPGRIGFCQSVKRALGEVDLFAAFVTGMGAIKLIREDLFDFSTFRTFAAEGLQVFKLLESRAVLRGAGHDVLLGCLGGEFKQPTIPIPSCAIAVADPKRSPCAAGIT